MEPENKSHIKGDLLLVIAILLLAGAGLLFNHIQKQKTPSVVAEHTQDAENEPAATDQRIIINSNERQQQSAMTAYVEISIDGQIIETLDLSQNTVMTINGHKNGTNHLIIEDGQVWIDDASCPDKVCIHQGKISRNSEIIVCLPNLMIAQIRIAESTRSPELPAE